MIGASTICASSTCPRSSGDEAARASVTPSVGSSRRLASHSVALRRQRCWPRHDAVWFGGPSSGARSWARIAARRISSVAHRSRGSVRQCRRVEDVCVAAHGLVSARTMDEPSRHRLRRSPRQVTDADICGCGRGRLDVQARRRSRDRRAYSSSEPLRIVGKEYGDPIDPDHFELFTDPR